jgi:hypothetical protein
MESFTPELKRLLIEAGCAFVRAGASHAAGDDDIDFHVERPFNRRVASSEPRDCWQGTPEDPTNLQ